MNFNKLMLSVFLVASASVFASSVLAASDKMIEMSPDFGNGRQIDTKNWIRLPINVVNDQGKGETIELFLPSEPEFINSPVSNKPLIVAKDSEGMTYKFSRMILPSNEYTLRQSFEFLLETLSLNYSVISYAYPLDNSIDSAFGISYVSNDGTRTMLTINKSKNFIYFFETTASNKLYVGLKSAKEGDELNEVMIHDILKHAIFSRSFLTLIECTSK